MDATRGPNSPSQPRAAQVQRCPEWVTQLGTCQHDLKTSVGPQQSTAEWTQSQRKQYEAILESNRPLFQHDEWRLPGGSQRAFGLALRRAARETVNMGGGGDGGGGDMESDVPFDVSHLASTMTDDALQYNKLLARRQARLARSEWAHFKTHGAWPERKSQGDADGNGLSSSVRNA